MANLFGSSAEWTVALWVIHAVSCRRFIGAMAQRWSVARCTGAQGTRSRGGTAAWQQRHVSSLPRRRGKCSGDGQSLTE
jgi:hypothetical protein